MADIYRKSALERISSPEQLDKAIVITTPMSWLALGAATVLVVAGIIFSIFGSLWEYVTTTGYVTSPIDTNAVYAPVSGTIVDVQVFEGSRIDPGTVVATYRINDYGEAKEITANKSGTVTTRLVKPGDKVTVSQDILRFTPASPYADFPNRSVVVCYVPQRQATDLKDGMDVTVTIDSVAQDKKTFMARIICVDEFPTTAAGKAAVIGNDNNVAANFSSDSSVVAVTCDLLPDEHNKEPGQIENPQYWLKNGRGTAAISNRSIVEVKIRVKRVRPITMLFDKLEDIWEGKK